MKKGWKRQREDGMFRETPLEACPSEGGGVSFSRTVGGREDEVSAHATRPQKDRPLQEVADVEEIRTVVRYD